MTQITHRLSALRNDKGLSQKALAQLSNMSVKTYWQYEHGVNKPGLDALITIANFYNVSIDYLVGRDDIPNRRIKA